MRGEPPYFMQNSDWYYTIDGDLGYYLTKTAPPEAVKSYKEYYGDTVLEDENGDEWLIER